MTNKNNSGVTLRRKPKTNLKGLLFLYEKNFMLIKEIIPTYRKNLNLSYLLPEADLNSRVTLELNKDSKYTSTLVIKQSGFSTKELVTTEIVVAIYHDIRMAEVRKFNGRQLFWARNKYPNKNMFHRDEKYQWNKFFSEWLIFSKKEGLAEKIVHINAP